MIARRLGAIPAGLVVLGLAAPGLVGSSAAPRSAVPAPMVAPAPAAGSGPVNGVPAAELDQMRREAPLVAAASRIRHAAEDGAAAGYVGVALTSVGDGVDVYWKGTPADAIRAVIDREATSVRVTVRPAPYSRAELDAAAAQVSAAVTRPGESRRVSVSFPVTGDGVTVRTDTADRTRALLPKVAVPVTVTALPKALRRATAPKPAATAKAAASAANEGAWPSPSRQRDAKPAWGGAHIINYNATGGNQGWLSRDEFGAITPADDKWHCTSGFPVLNTATNTELMVGAASCGAPRQLFVNANGEGVNDPLAGDANWLVESLGLMLTRPAGGAEPFIYTGGSWSDTGWSVSAHDYLLANQHVCITGAETGLMCGATVTTEIGTRTRWMAASQGNSLYLTGMTGIELDTTRRVYVLKDQSLCNGLSTIEVYCAKDWLGEGDIGAPIFTIDGGDKTGVTVRGIYLTNRYPENGEAFTSGFGDAMDADKVLRTFANLGTPLQILNQQNNVR